MKNVGTSPKPVRRRVFPDLRPELEKLVSTDSFDGSVRGHAVREESGAIAWGMGKQNQIIQDLLTVAQRYSIAAVSRFRVGSVCQGASGDLYLGANLEIAGLPLSLTVHAEQSAVMNAFAHGEKAVCWLEVTNAPCGFCRQFLKELENASSLEIRIANKGNTTLGFLLPDSFGPRDLGMVGGLLNHGAKHLSLTPASNDPLALAALKAANLSYSPYTNSYSGVALRTSGGRIASASYVENAAYNPSVSPIIGALDRLRFSGAQLGDISDAVLVEVESSKISQEDLTRMVLDTIATGVALRIYKAVLKH